MKLISTQCTLGYQRNKLKLSLLKLNRDSSLLEQIAPQYLLFKLNSKNPYFN